DAFLRIEDAKGKHLAHDDDSGGGTNARLFFTPRQGGTYRLIATAYPRGEPRGTYTLTVRLADARACVGEKGEALNREGAKRYQRGEREGAGKVWREALTLCRQLYPKEKYPDGHLKLAISLNNLGTLLRHLGKLEEAGNYLKEALAICKKALPKDHPDLAT